MSQTPEGKLTAAVQRRLNQLKAQGVPIWWLKLHGGPMQRRGVPDLLILVAGRALFVELKAPGKRPSPLQQARMNEIEAAKGMAVVAWDVRDVQQAIDLMMKGWE